MTNPGAKRPKIAPPPLSSSEGWICYILILLLSSEVDPGGLDVRVALDGEDEVHLVPVFNKLANLQICTVAIWPTFNIVYSEDPGRLSSLGSIPFQSMHH